MSGFTPKSLYSNISASISGWSVSLSCFSRSFSKKQLTPYTLDTMCASSSGLKPSAYIMLGLKHCFILFFTSKKTSENIDVISYGFHTIGLVLVSCHIITNSSLSTASTFGVILTLLILLVYTYVDKYFTSAWYLYILFGLPYIHNLTFSASIFI